MALDEERPADQPDRREGRDDRSPSGGQGSGAAPGPETAGAKPKRAGLLKRHAFWILLAVMLVLAAAGGGYWYWLTYSHPFETTDDAFIDSRQFAVAPQVSGAIADVLVEDNQHVNAGDVLFRIDPRDYQAALEEAKARVASAQASVNGADAQIAAQQAQVQEANARVEQAQASLAFAQQQPF